ncbi:hypothetical protein [Amycolatopsis pithecellobii]|uniref:EthD domain-containing protein n=1 Tax=Amycolatopsis pithecellobii TaxID=664692 RepID=A0A6N7YQZ3_9PSEU|nr:hypothetical protein [Amycolatopsis pithecellobii]MTD55437.1 hypothetical protein [Amycolatopsis pithecellobii]
MSDITPGMMIVAVDFDREHDEELNSWYDEEHVPERAAIDGVTGVRRFVRTEGGFATPPGMDIVTLPKYLQVYDLSDINIPAGKEWSALSEPAAVSERSLRNFPFVRNVSRGMYVEMRRFK